MQQGDSHLDVLKGGWRGNVPGNTSTDAVITPLDGALAQL